MLLGDGVGPGLQSKARVVEVSDGECFQLLTCARIKCKPSEVKPCIDARRVAVDARE